MNTTNFHHHDPLTLRTARTLREIDNDPLAWKQSGRDAVAEEERIRQAFIDDETPPESRSSIWAHRVIYALALGMVVYVIWGRA